MIAYAHSSALVKPVLAEPESAELHAHLQAYEAVVSSSLAEVEVTRAARRASGAASAERASAVLGNVGLAVDANVLRKAASLPPLVLRSLDAIHLASALELGGDVTVVAYDRRLLDLAVALDLRVSSPGAVP